MRFLSLLLLLITVSAFGQRLVLPGDYPDPSVVKVGDTYWASATTSNWAPAFPILKSKDLLTWEMTSHVFTELPPWADYYFWAPEISYDNGKAYVYYTAHKEGGNLCVATAVADRPEGPYKDLGPLICQEVGSIDAFPMRDENGKLFILWKEDGNSVNMPTPIWISEMSEDRTKLIGEKKELFRNDKEWEGNLVEGVSILRHGKYYYAFYAGAGCCGRGCTYNMGVARSEKLLGPWEKYEKNPLILSDEKWKCPGHGTPVEKDGKYFLLHHAYDTGSGVFTGREGILTQFEFTDDEWIRFVPEKTSSALTQNSLVDNFDGGEISKAWQWSVFDSLDYKIKEKKLYLESDPDKAGSFVARKVTSHNYMASVKIFPGSHNVASGIGLIGDEKNFVRLMVKGNNIEVEGMQTGEMKIIEQLEIKHNDPLVVRIEVKNGKEITFYVGKDEKSLQVVNQSPIDGFFLPPWDRAVRIALIAQGLRNNFSIFDDFSLHPHP